MSSIKIGRYTVEITHPDRVLFPADGITKDDLITYYQEIAPVMIPHMKGRLLTMQRFPQGITHEGFYHKNAPDYFPTWIKLKAVRNEDEGIVNYVVCNNAATLVYLANYACITPHLWLSKIDKLRYPDQMIFDLDPSGKDFNLVRTTALQLKELLEDELGLTTFVKTTGSRGLHVMVPIKRQYDFDVVHELAHDIARIMVARYPKTCTVTMSKAKRGGKIFVDYLRNTWAQTAVAPYAVRPRKGAPVAAPIEWKEVGNKKLSPQKYTIYTMLKQVDKVGDIWQNAFKKPTSLTKVRLILDNLLSEHDLLVD